MKVANVKFFFDYKSPFSFLALRHTLQLEKDFSVKVDWLPFSFNVTEGFGDPQKRTEYQQVKLKLVTISFDIFLKIILILNII